MNSDEVRQTQHTTVAPLSLGGSVEAVGTEFEVRSVARPLRIDVADDGTPGLSG